MIGPIECYALGNERTAAKNGDSELCCMVDHHQTYFIHSICQGILLRDESHWSILMGRLHYWLVFGFSQYCRYWPLFSVLVYSFTVVTLTRKATRLGHRYAWSDRIVNLPFFDSYPYQGQGYVYGQPTYYPQGGHTLVVQPHRHGDPTVQVIPSNVG